MATRYVKQGARTPPLSATLQDGDGTAIDVSTATSITLTVATQAGALLISAQTMSLEGDGTDGRVTYAFQAGDTDTVGTHKLEIDVNWADGTRTTFPDNGHGTLVITDDLDV